MPNRIESEKELIDQMCSPSPAVREAVAQLDGDIMVLGAGGKMGPTLCELLVRAGARRVIAVSRYSDTAQRQSLEEVGVETVAADLLDAAALRDLPEAPYIYLMAGFKFGATGNEDTTWAMNTELPGQIVRRFASSQIVYVSSGNVYAYSGISSVGADEDGALEPIGEYAQSRLGGERLAQYWARVQGTRLAIARLFYATELRYGIIHDLAWKIWQREPIDLTMGYVNQIWQGDANAYLCRFFPLCKSPTAFVNLTGAQVLSTRALSERLGQLMDVAPLFVNQEAQDALLGDSRRLFAQLGTPETEVEQMLEWTAHWVQQGGKSLGKPTKYESRSGKF
ncbi:MAG: NAD-dependent epimerase/dehydratase family protein [Candidatus Latescibacterota bacterium]|jgi:nucleoside-diphosphate-sugar epimerase